MIIDDDDAIRDSLQKILSAEYQISAVGSGREAMEFLMGPAESRPDLVMLDHYLDDMSGGEVQQELLDHGIDVPVIFMTGHMRTMEVAKVSSRGAAGYLPKPFDLDQAKEIIAQVLRQVVVRREFTSASTLPELDPSEKFIGRSPLIADIFRKVGLVAPTGHTVLITGETGTGKSMLAEAIHTASDRRRQVFIAFNCAGIPETLMESELFGHMKNAFTDAGAPRAGYFEAANKGTIFLDEIGDMTLNTQVKLLKVLDSREIIRLGSTTPTKVDVRVIAATHRNLAREVREGRFRADLYYRLNVFPIHMPALRDRADDIPVLVAHFLRLFPFRPTMPPADIAPEALERLKAYDWQGNVRDLMHVIQRAVIFSQGELVMPEHIVFNEALEPTMVDVGQMIRYGAGIEEILFATQKEAVRAALMQANNNIPRAAEILKMGVEAFTRLRFQTNV